MFFGPCRRIWEIGSLGKFLSHVTRNIAERFQVRLELGFENHFVAVFFNDDFRARKPKSFRQSNRLAAAMLKKLGGVHSYNM